MDPKGGQSKFQSPKSRIESPILMSSEIGCNKDCMRTCDTRYAIPKYSAQISDLRRARSAWHCVISSSLGGQRMPRAGTRLEHPIISNNKLVIGCSGHSPARGIRWPPRLIISLLLLCRNFFVEGKTWAACASNRLCRCSLSAPSQRRGSWEEACLRRSNPHKAQLPCLRTCQLGRPRCRHRR